MPGIVPFGEAPPAGMLLMMGQRRAPVVIILLSVGLDLWWKRVRDARPVPGTTT